MREIQLESYSRSKKKSHKSLLALLTSGVKWLVFEDLQRYYHFAPPTAN